MFPVAAELKDELRTRMLQARTREGAEPCETGVAISEALGISPTS